jgi:PilZ domain-containing protein
MNSIVVRETTAATGRILFIEPDARRAAVLGAILRENRGTEVDIVPTVAAALRSLDAQVPDLLLTSTFLPPADEATLTAYLNGLPAARHLQTITVPYFIDDEGSSGAESSSANVLTFLRRRQPSIRPRCDERTLRELIGKYLAQATAARQETVYRGPTHALPAAYRAAVAMRPHVESIEVALATASRPLASVTIMPEMPADRRRSRRRTSGDLPWLWTVKLAGGAQVRVVDISTTGVLLETASRLSDGSTMDLQLLGQDTNVTVPARMIRSHVASVDGVSVKYRVAATFAHQLALPGLQQASRSVTTPEVLGDLLNRIMSNLDRCSSEAALRGSFERELRRILPVRDVQIRATPVIPERGAESIYFTVPHGGGDKTILQAIFDPDYIPTAMDFRLLKASASLAAVVLEFAPR